MKKTLDEFRDIWHRKEKIIDKAKNYLKEAQIEEERAKHVAREEGFKFIPKNQHHEFLKSDDCGDPDAAMERKFEELIKKASLEAKELVEAAKRVRIAAEGKLDTAKIDEAKAKKAYYEARRAVSNEDAAEETIEPAEAECQDRIEKEKSKPAMVEPEAVAEADENSLKEQQYDIQNLRRLKKEAVTTTAHDSNNNNLTFNVEVFSQEAMDFYRSRATGVLDPSESGSDTELSEVAEVEQSSILAHLYGDAHGDEHHTAE